MRGTEREDSQLTFTPVAVFQGITVHQNEKEEVRQRPAVFISPRPELNYTIQLHSWCQTDRRFPKSHMVRRHEPVFQTENLQFLVAGSISRRMNEPHGQICLFSRNMSGARRKSVSTGYVNGEGEDCGPRYCPDTCSLTPCLLSGRHTDVHGVYGMLYM